MGKLKGLAIVIMILIAGNIYFWYYYAQNYYESGYDLGHSIGHNLGFEDGYDAGYVEGLEDGVGRGYTVRDPSYDEVVNFMTLDKTDENPYVEDECTCNYFAADFKNNAFQLGYKCGYVSISFIDSGHAIVCFNTTDHGLIFIEPQFDDIVILTIGESYSTLNGYVLIVGDTVESFIIIW